MLTAIDERTYGKDSGVLIQDEHNEIRIVRLSPANQEQFNRNDQSDLVKLWNLYESNSTEFRLRT